MAECNSCGGFVTDDYVRVFGDNEGNVSECRNCRARSDDAEEESDEREVLLREVTGTSLGDATRSGSGNETERPSAGGAASDDGESGRTTPDTAAAGSGSAATSGTRTAGGMGALNGGRSGAAGERAATEAEAASGSADGESSGARERLAGLLSSLRG